jgi:MFS family permease
VTRRGGLLRQRNFRLLWIGETVSGAGNAMAVIGVPLLAVTTLHASTFAVAALTAAAYLPWLVIGLPAGAWVDRLPPRPLMIGCDALSALLYASLPVAAWAGLLRTGQVVAVALLAGAVNVFFSTAYQVYLPCLVRPAELAEGNAKLQGSAQAAAIAGRGAAGLATVAGAATALLCNAASFLVSAWCLLRIRAAAAPRPASAPVGVAAGTWQGIRFVARDRYLRPLTVYGAVANLAYSGNLALVVVFLVRVVGLGSAAIALLTATAGLGGVLGAALAGRLIRALGTARALTSTALCGGLSGLLAPFTAPGPRIACYVIGSGAVSAGLSVGNVIVASFRQTYCPPAMLGRVTASMRVTVWGTIPLGSLLAGALGTALGIRTGLLTMFALFAASTLLLLTRDLRTTKDLPASPFVPD